MSNEKAKNHKSMNSEHIIGDIKLTAQLSVMGMEEILEFCQKETESHKLIIALGQLSKLLQESKIF